MGTVGSRVQPDLPHPAIHNPRVLTRREVRRFVDPSGKQLVIAPKPGAADPVRHRLAGLLSEFELHLTPGLLLHDDRPGTNTIAMRNVSDTQPDQIASAQRAVDG